MSSHVLAGASSSRVGIAARLADELAEIEPLPRFDLDGAERRARIALSAARALGGIELILRVQMVQADVLERRGNVAESGLLANDVNRWATEHAHPYLLARSHYVLEAVFQDVGDTSRALEHAVQAVHLLPETAAPEIHFDHLVRLADCLALSGSLEAARERYPDVLRIAETLGDVDRQLLALNNRSFFEARVGNFSLALELSDRMQALAARNGTVLHIGRLDTVARVLIGLGRLAEAEVILLPALDPAARAATPDGDAGAACLLTLAEIQRLSGKLNDAQVALDECVRLAKERGIAGVAIAAAREQAELLAAAGDYRAAYELHKVFHADTIAAQSAERDARARTLHAMYETTEARQQSRRYRELSLRDPLTGLYNRRYVEEELPELLRRSAETAEVLTVALVDLDHFKHVNDAFSHEVGDRVLGVIAGLLAAAALRAAVGRRVGSFTARMGGEEFLLVFATVDAAGADVELDQLCRDIREYPWAELAGPLPVTVSVGATIAGVVGETTGDLLGRADQHLYAAKRGGRDRVVTDAS